MDSSTRYYLFSFGERLQTDALGKWRSAAEPNLSKDRCRKRSRKVSGERTVGSWSSHCETHLWWIENCPNQLAPWWWAIPFLCSTHLCEYPFSFFKALNCFLIVLNTIYIVSPVTRHGYHQLASIPREQKGDQNVMEMRYKLENEKNDIFQI